MVAGGGGVVGRRVNPPAPRDCALNGARRFAWSGSETRALVWLTEVTVARDAGRRGRRGGGGCCRGRSRGLLCSALG